jgi:hypothetical protein
MWRSIGDGGMDGHGVAALVIGVVGSLALGGGLMALLFFSARHGYDERVEPFGPGTDPVRPEGPPFSS